jgi:hypothetical protein
MTRRHPLTRLVLIAVLTAVLAAGCGIRPSGVITGGPAPAVPVVDGPPAPWGTTLYFLADSSLRRVLRPTRQLLSPTQALTLLQDGPDGAERPTGLTSEVPTGLDPVSVTTDASGDVDVVVAADVTTLSDTAVDQIVCTVREALATAAPITVSSGAARRGPRLCPVPG